MDPTLVPQWYVRRRYLTLHRGGPPIIEGSQKNKIYHIFYLFILLGFCGRALIMELPTPDHFVS